MSIDRGDSRNRNRQNCDDVSHDEPLSMNNELFEKWGPDPGHLPLNSSVRNDFKLEESENQRK